MSVEIELVMTPELRSKLRALAALADSDALDAPLLAAGMEIANDAKGKAPFVTGTLRRSIRAEAVGPGDVRVGTDVPYGARIEFGFIGADRLGRNYHQAAQPYLRPAFEENKDRVRQVILDGAMDVLRRITRG